MAQTITNLAVNGLNPVTVGGTGTAIKYFPFVPGASIGVASTYPGQLFVPGNGRLNGQRFTARATGDFEVGPGGACPNFTVAMYANTATPITLSSTPTYTTLATSGAIVAQNLTSVFYPWTLQVDLWGSQASGIVNGSASITVDNTTANLTTLSNNLSGINFNTSDPAFGLVVGVTFSVSEAGNKANMYQFELIA